MALPRIDVEKYTPAAITSVRRSVGWRGLFLQERRGGSGDVRYLGGPRQHLLYRFLQPCISHARVAGETRRLSYRTGELRFTPAGHSVEFKWIGEVRVLILGLEPWFLEGLAAELGATLTFDPLLNFRKLSSRHPTSLLMKQLGAELAAPAGAALVAESLARAVGVELLREFAELASPKPAEAPAPVAVLRAVGLMRERLTDSLSLDEMAAVAGVSSFHFARLFKTATGHPPHEYLIRLRVDHAQGLIVNHGRSLTMAGIAQESGFADQSHMARHFRRVLGVTPGEFAEAHRQRGERA